MIKTVGEIWSSVNGNMKTRTNDPIIGAFICSWILCNWDRLALLFWGKGELDSRLDRITEEMAFLTNPSLIFTNYDLLLLPIFLTVFYVFLMPNISVKVSRFLANTEIARHGAAVDVEVEQARKQKELSVERLLADPNEKYLVQAVEQQLAQEKALSEKVEADKEAAKAKMDAERDKASAAESQAKSALLDKEKKERQAERDKMALSESASMHKAVLQSNAYTSSYLFIEMLSASVQDDGVVLSLRGLTDSISAVFGYSSYDELLNANKFNNDELNNLKYVVCDTDYLSGRFESILSAESLDEGEYDSEWLIGHVEMIFDKLPYDFIYQDALADKVFDMVEEEQLGFIDSEEVSAAQAETDSIIEEIILDDKAYDFDNKGFVVQISGNASGYHRKDSSIAGRGINLSITATLPVLIGKFGLQGMDIELSAMPEDYGDMGWDESEPSLMEEPETEKV